MRKPALNRHTADMDAGGVALVGAIAGVVGAAVGAGGAVTAARAAGRQQGLQWRRQIRRDAYVAYLGGVHDLYRRLDVLAKKARTAADQEFWEEVSQARTLVSECEKLRLVVALEGTGDVNESALELWCALSEWFKEIRRADYGDPSIAANSDGVLRGCRRAATSALEDVHSQCRQVLDADMR
ncbi:hypothetical protein [Streptomyces spiramyceticus]|uniref:hypothetical protein n=1 Tax=Streptomyces spiramyceticus TaxID=299717 RepID=UPI00237BD11D|nr:hypothetical protein [Streptomyces spiramyceticus]